MKKFLVTVLAALLALGCFAFAACDESGTPGGDTDPADIVSDKLTEAEWDAAIAESAFDNVTMKLTQTEGEKSDTSLVKLAKSAERTLVYQSGASGEVYYDCTAAKTEQYYKEGGEWAKTELSGFSASQYLVYAAMLADGYGKIPYVDAEKAYVAENYAIGGSMTADKVTVKFSGKKLAYERFDVTTDGGAGVIEVQYYDYGKTGVTLPTLGGETPSGDKMSQTEWEALFAAEVFDNYTIKFTTQVDRSNSQTPQIQHDGFAQQKDAQTERVHYWRHILNSTFGYTDYYYDKQGDTYIAYENKTPASYDDIEEGNIQYGTESGSEQPLDASKVMTDFAGWYDKAAAGESGTYTVQGVPLGVPGWGGDSQFTDEGYNVTLTIENGKVTAFDATATFKQPNMSGTILHTVTTHAQLSYGDTEIVLPTDIAVDSDTVPSTIVSEQLGETEWTNAFTPSNYANLTFCMDTSEGGETTREEIEFAYANGTTLIHRDTETDGANKRYYYEITPTGESWRYRLDSGRWYKEIPAEEGDPFSTETYLALLLPLGQARTQLTFADGAYTADSVTVGNLTYTDVTLKFLNGMPAYVKGTLTSSENEGALTLEARLYDYGTTSVSLPTNVTE